MLPNEAWISEEDVRLIMKDNDVVHQMQFDLELSLIEDVGNLPEFLSKVMNDDTDDKEYVFQNVTDILSIIVVTKSASLKKD